MITKGGCENERKDLVKMNKEIKKICSKCGKEFKTKNKTQSYCDKCYKDYQKAYRDKHKSYYIYMFVDAYNVKNVFYIGSTTNIKQRTSYHLNRYSKVLQKLEEHNIEEYDIIYTKLDLKSRQELYFIEYYLIHKHYLQIGIAPICNEIDTMKTDIKQDRQLELILIAESLKYNYL